LLPDHAPDAVQELVFVDDQESVEVPPFWIEAGLALRESVGVGGDGGGATDPTGTVVVVLALPPAPVQVNEKLVLTVSVAVASSPEVDLSPVQPPLASHCEASVDDQESVVVPPIETDAGDALNDTLTPGTGTGDSAATFGGSDVVDVLQAPSKAKAASAIQAPRKGNPKLRPMKFEGEYSNTRMCSSWLV
jgi:hypothetical protein